MEKKIIHTTQSDFLKCDNAKCNYVLKEKEESRTLESYIGEPCPLCSENLLSKDDFLRHKKVLKFIGFINKCFGWLGTYENDPENEYVGSIGTHEGINIKLTEKEQTIKKRKDSISGNAEILANYRESYNELTEDERNGNIGEQYRGLINIYYNAVQEGNYEVGVKNRGNGGHEKNMDFFDPKKM